MHTMFYTENYLKDFFYKIDFTYSYKKKSIKHFFKWFTKSSICPIEPKGILALPINIIMFSFNANKSKPHT